jgi:hypothetical protein
MKSLNQIARMLFMSLLSMTFLFSACKKDDEVITKTDLLTSGAWKATALTIDPAFPTFDNEGNITGSTNDLFAMMEDCSRDDIISFKADKTLIMDEGASKCDNADPQKNSGSWSFNSDETTLTITVDGDPQTMTIMELTDKVIKLKATEVDEGMTFSITTTFSH